MIVTIPEDSLEHVRIIKTFDAVIKVYGAARIEFYPPDPAALEHDEVNNAMTRARLFLIALASAQINEVDFARKLGITQTGLSRILKGQSKSKAVTQNIDRFIGNELRRLRINIVKPLIESENRIAQKREPRKKN